MFAEIEDSPEEMADLIGEYMGEAGEIELHEIDEKNEEDPEKQLV